MVEYIVDGSEKGLVQGVGVVRVKDGKEQYLSSKRKINNKMIGTHEENAIIKTLEVIAENNDKTAIIYNDSRTVISRLKGGQIRKKQKLLRRIKDIADTLRSQGFDIKFAHLDKVGKRRQHMKAHELSRNYM